MFQSEARNREAFELIKKKMNEEKKDLTRLKDILTGLFQDSQLPFNPADGQIWKVWDDTVGEPIARNARPIWIKNGRLKVHVSDPTWLQELEFLSADIKDKINQKLARKAVEHIEFRLRR